MTIPQAFQQAIQRHQAGRLSDAEVFYRQILAVQPNHAGALHHLGIIANQMGRHDLAVEWIRHAIALNPNDPSAYSNLGEAYRSGDRLEEAIASFHRALQLRPEFPEAYNNLGNALCQQGRIEEAVAACRRALQLKPDYPEAYNNLGNTLRERGEPDEAVAAFRRALELRPDLLEAHNNLGNVLRDCGRLDDAIAAYRRGIELKPGCVEAHNGLGGALKAQGRLDEALAAFRRALQLKPQQPRAHSNLIYTLHFHAGHDDRIIVEEQQRWNQQFAEPLKRFALPHQNDHNPERRLRIGYVSPNFREQAVGLNLMPLFECHDRSQFEILCYSGVMKPDNFTEAFRRRADHWRNTVGVADQALAEMIRHDRVDILVDLTQHMTGNRLPVFARQPAPVQVSFAGYPESTGLKAIGYRMSDRYLEGDLERMKDEGGRMNLRPSSPSGPLLQPNGTEQVFLLDSFWCYDPCGAVVEVNTLDAQKGGRVTFGSLNNFCKVNEPVLKLWARVLRQVEDSRLILLSHPGSHQQRTLEVLEQEGIEAQRVEFVELRPRRAYLELYHRLDIVLDPFPYNGHTTSLDALWMGVPMVSLVGEQPVSRAGFSQLSNLGLPELAAFSEDDYVDIATRLAHDLPRLAELRDTLRPRMQASPLMDAPRFARNIEVAYRAMWQAWCAR